MLDQQISDLGSIVDAMESGGGAPDSDSLDNLARTLAKLFGVDKDEVAVLKVRNQVQEPKIRTSGKTHSRGHNSAHQHHGPGCANGP